MLRKVPFIFVVILACSITSFSSAQNSSAKIVSVNPDEKTAVIDKGSSETVAENMVFFIIDEDSYKIGSATVISVMENESTVAYAMDSETIIRPSEGMTVLNSKDEEALKVIRQDVGIVLPMDTEVKLEMVDRIGSQVSKIGDVFKLKTKEPVIVDGYEVIRKDAEAVGEVTYAEAAKGWGKSGSLNVEIKYVKAADGSNVPLSFEMTQNKKDNYAKAAIGSYMTGFIGGGAMKGKKIWIDPGREFRVFVKNNVRMAFVVSDDKIESEAVVKSDLMAKNPASNTRILFLGLQDSFSEDGSGVNMVLTSKLASFISYYLQWNTSYQFVKRHKVIERTGYDLDEYFLKRGAEVPAEERYNMEALKKLGDDFSVDYVICGDVLKHSLTSKKKRNWLKTVAAISSPSISNMDGQVKQQYSFDVAIDIMVYDVKKNIMTWNSVYKDFHQVSMPLGVLNSMGIGKPEPEHKGQIGKYHVNVYDLEGYELTRSDDPISFSATDEGYTIMRAISPLITELESAL